MPTSGAAAGQTGPLARALTEPSDPQNPYTTARLLIARHAETAGDYAAAEMAHAQGVGDAGDYDCWAEIYDAVAVLQAPPASRTSGP
jgi:hypothetical protein